MVAITKPLNYRPDIDGLRAFAVLAVIFYHLDFPQISGGFSGVDVFFVISGFLITRILREEIAKTGSVSYSNFYIRRVRRLLPSLFFTLFLCGIVAVVLFSPDHLSRFGASFLHSSLSLSNIYFWQEVGYFDIDSKMKPLLHTWSLGVEEQFYLIWPLLISLLAVRKNKWLIPAALVFAIVLSLLLNMSFIDAEWSILRQMLPPRVFETGPSTIFYLLPFRLYEFSIGALLVWVCDFRIKWKWAEEILLLFGIGLVGFSFFAFDSDTLWPGYAALVPCLGAALVIYAGRARLLGKVFRNSPMIKIGLISYSLYLIHWPIIVFYTYWTLRPLSLPEQIAILIASLISAALMYRFIEQRFRLRRGDQTGLSPAAFGLVCTGVVLVFVFLSANMWATGGWSWRNETLVSEEQFVQFQEERLKNTINACTLTMMANKDFSAYRADGALRCNRAAETNIVVMGDSHAVDGFNSFHALFDGDSRVNLIYSLKDGGADQCNFRVDSVSNEIVGNSNASCVERIAAINSDVWSNVDVIVLDIFDNSERNYGNVQHLMNKHPHLKLVVMGVFIGTRPHRCSDLANRFGTFDACKSPSFVTNFGGGNLIEGWAPSDRTVYIDRVKLLCGSEQKLSNCSMTVLGGGPVFMDGDHFTLTASRELAKMIRRDYQVELSGIGIELKQ